MLHSSTLPLVTAHMYIHQFHRWARLHKPISAISRRSLIARKNAGNCLFHTMKAAMIRLPQSERWLTISRAETPCSRFQYSGLRPKDRYTPKRIPMPCL